MSVSIKEVASRAGVSISTVSRVINGSKKVSPLLKVKVERAISETNYSTNSIARGLKISKTKNIAVIITAISRTFFTDVLEGISKEAEEHGYSVVIAETYDSIEKEMYLVDYFVSQWVDGIILASSAYGNGLKVRKYLEGLDKLDKKGARIPVITLEYPINNKNVDAVAIDNEQAAYEAVTYLIRQIHCKNILHICIPFEHYLGQERMAGFKRALEENGLPFVQENVVECDYTSYSGYKAVKKIAGQRRDFDGIFCDNDQMAVGGLKACEELHIRIPEDVAIMGNDDVFVASVVSPSLSSIHVPKYEMGALAMKRLVEVLSAIEEGKKYPKRKVLLLQHQIIERESTVKDNRESLKYLFW